MADRPVARRGGPTIATLEEVEIDVSVSPIGQRRRTAPKAAEVTVEKLLVDKTEAGAMLGLSPITVMRLGNDGAFPVVRIGSRVLYRVDDLKAYIAQKVAEDVASHAQDA